MIQSLFVLLLLASACTARDRPSDTQDKLPDIDMDMVPRDMRMGLFGSVYKDGRHVLGHDDPGEDIPTVRQTEKDMRKKLGLSIPGEREVPPGPDQDYDDEDEPVKPNPNKTAKSESRAKLWYDFPTLYEKNLGIGGKNKAELKSKWRTSVVVPTPEPMPKKPHFSNDQFTLQKEEEFTDKIYRKRVINWTDCNDFSRGAKFHPNDIVDLDWVPFYAWSLNEISRAAVHTFKRPTLRLVQEFQERFGPYLGKKVDWDSPKLTLEIDHMFELLMFAVDNKGMFTALRNIKLPDNFRDIKNAEVPLVNLLLKIEHPYLVMMDCDEEYAIAMAVDGQGPENVLDKKMEADSIGFQGIGAPLTRDLVKEEFKRRMASMAPKVPPHAKKMLKTSMDHGIYGSKESQEVAGTGKGEGSNKNLTDDEQKLS